MIPFSYRGNLIISQEQTCGNPGLTDTQNGDKIPGSEIRPLDDLVNGTAIPLVFATMNKVWVLLVHLLAYVCKRRLGSIQRVSEELKMNEFKT